MNVPNHQGEEAQAAEEAVHIEIEIEDRVEMLVVTPTGEGGFVELIRSKFDLSEEVHLFERDHEEPLAHHHGRGRKHIRVVGHCCHEVSLAVRFDHETRHHHFRPSATIFRALQWAVSKHGFRLDAMAAAKANLILPGADAPLPREDVLGKYVKPDHCALVVDLTLKDFTNG